MNIQKRYADLLQELERRVYAMDRPDVARCCKTHADLYFHEMHPEDEEVARVCREVGSHDFSIHP